MPSVPVGRKLIALVDPVDYALVAAHRWHVQPGHLTTYARESPICPCGSTSRRMMHGMILGVAGVDHLDGDGLNNRRSNIRSASIRQNTANRTKPHLARPLTSRYKGVSRLYGQGPWRASIGSRQRRTFLGSFSDEVAAARAYDTAARARYGRFACLNFPQPGERGAI